MGRSLLVDTMHKLFAEGLIVAHKFGKSDDCFVLSPKQIEKALDERKDKKEHYYRLTKKGGEYWEAFASPQWDYFIYREYGLPDDSGAWVGELVCMTKDFLEDYFQSLRYHVYEIYENTIKWDVLRPWEATYWKELPIGHRVKFKCKGKKYKYDPDNPGALDLEWYDDHDEEWFANQWYRWR